MHRHRKSCKRGGMNSMGMNGMGMNGMGMGMGKSYGGRSRRMRKSRRMRRSRRRMRM